MNGPRGEENLSSGFANAKDQPDARRMTSAFVIRVLESIISVNSNGICQTTHRTG